MTNFILFDDGRRISLRPLTFLRPVSEIRSGIVTMKEKWENYLKQPVSYLTEPYLQEKFPLHVASNNILINSGVYPNRLLLDEILSLDADSVLMKNNQIIAIHLTAEDLKLFKLGKAPNLMTRECMSTVKQILNTWDIFSNNKSAIIEDFDLLTKNRKSAELPPTNQLLGNQIFIEQGATIHCSSINTLHGPVYIGRDAIVMQGSHIEGPVAICDNAIVKMGSLLYPGTTVGPYCKVGGEISNSVLFSYSSKAHYGFLGDSVIAEWCNLGAGTTCSNLKNNYETVKQWNSADNRFITTGLQFCGLVMGDHCKTGISTMFNSGTTVGVYSNIFGPGYQRNFIASFSWGGTSGFRKHKPEEAIETARAVYTRRNLNYTETEQSILNEVFQITSKVRFL